MAAPAPAHVFYYPNGIPFEAAALEAAAFEAAALEADIAAATAVIFQNIPLNGCLLLSKAGNIRVIPPFPYGAFQLASIPLAHYLSKRGLTIRDVSDYMVSGGLVKKVGEGSTMALAFSGTILVSATAPFVGTCPESSLHENICTVVLGLVPIRMSKCGLDPCIADLMFQLKSLNPDIRLKNVLVGDPKRRFKITGTLGMTTIEFATSASVGGQAAFVPSLSVSDAVGPDQPPSHTLKSDPCLKVAIPIKDVLDHIPVSSDTRVPTPVSSGGQVADVPSLPEFTAPLNVTASFKSVLDQMEIGERGVLASHVGKLEEVKALTSHTRLKDLVGLIPQSYVLRIAKPNSPGSATIYRVAVPEA